MPRLSGLDAVAYFGKLHWKYITVPVDKSTNNFALICKINFISKILSEVGEYINIQFNSTYSKPNFSKDYIIENNENYCQKSGLKLAEKDCSLPIMYWL